MDNKLLILEQEFDAPIELVWRAITEKEVMKKWYFDLAEFELEVGFKFQFEGGDEGKRYMHLCEILEIVPQEKLSYSWEYEGHTGLSVVTFELSPVGEKTKVKLTHAGLETFTNPDFMRENFVGGWNYLIHKSLKEFLEKGNALMDW